MHAGKNSCSIADLSDFVLNIKDNRGIKVLLILCYPAKRYLQLIPQA
jgi:hypothetical protein